MLDPTHPAFDAKGSVVSWTLQAVDFLISSPRGDLF